MINESGGNSFLNSSVLALRMIERMVADICRSLMLVLIIVSYLSHSPCPAKLSQTVVAWTQIPGVLDAMEISISSRRVLIDGWIKIYTCSDKRL